MPISPLVRLSDQYQREAEWLIMQPLSESYATAVAYVKNIFQLWTVHPSYSETSLVWRNCWSICWFVLDPRCVMTLRYSFATLARALVCEFDVIAFSRNFWYSQLSNFYLGGLNYMRGWYERFDRIVLFSWYCFLRVAISDFLVLWQLYRLPLLKRQEDSPATGIRFTVRSRTVLPVDLVMQGG